MATKRSAKERRRSRRRAAMVLVPTVAGVFIAGTAFAYWSTTGSGTGTSITGTGATVTVTQTGTTPTGLSPGGTSQPIAFKITNGKTTPQYIASVTIAVGTIIKNSDGVTAATGCTAGDFAVTQPGAINTNLPAGDTAFNSTSAAIRMLESGSNQDGCKDVTVNLTYTAA
jgi:hypothetical protein